MIVVVESPLNAPTSEGVRENFRYLLWCMRAEYIAGNHPIASHLICPWFMNDSAENERNDGIAWPWMWGEIRPVGEEYAISPTHLFYADKGLSNGMIKSRDMCDEIGIPSQCCSLKESPECWKRYNEGAWPPHTKGFEF